MLLPSEREAMVGALQAARVPLQETRVNPSKAGQSLTPALQALLSKSPELKVAPGPLLESSRVSDFGPHWLAAHLSPAHSCQRASRRLMPGSLVRFAGVRGMARASAQHTLPLMPCASRRCHAHGARPGRRRAPAQWAWPLLVQR